MQKVTKESPMMWGTRIIASVHCITNTLVEGKEIGLNVVSHLESLCFLCI